MTHYVMAATEADGSPLAEDTVQAAPSLAEAAAFGDRHRARYVVAGREDGRLVTLFGLDGGGDWTVAAADVDAATAGEVRLWFGLTQHAPEPSDPPARVPAPGTSGLEADGAIAAVVARVRSRGTDYPTRGLAADRFAGGWCVYAPVEVDDGDPMAFLDVPVGRSVFLVSDLGRVKEASSSVPPQSAEAMFTAEEAFVRGPLDEERFMTDLRDETLRLDGGPGGPAAIASFSVDATPPEVIAARASGLLGPVIQQLALLGPAGWTSFTAVFSCTVAADIARARFRAGGQDHEVRVPEQIAVLVRRQRHLAGRMPAGPWWRLLLTASRGPATGASAGTEYDYGDQPLPAQDLLDPASYRADLAAYPRPAVPAWLTAYAEGDHAGPSGAGTPSTPAQAAPAPAHGAPAPVSRPATPPPGGGPDHSALAQRLEGVGREASLGALWDVYPPALLSSSRLGCFGVGAAVLAIGGVVMLATGDALGVALLAGALAFTVYTIRGGAGNSRTAPTGAATFDHGVVLIDPHGQAHVFRWESTTVRQRIVNHMHNGVHVNTTHTYELTRPDGTGVTIGRNSAMPGLANPEKWGRELQEGITRARLPHALRTVAEGGSLTFGPIEVTARAVVAKGRSVPWTDIEQIKVEQGHISLRISGKWFSLINTEVSRIPNFFVFHAVAEHLRRSARGE